MKWANLPLEWRKGGGHTKLPPSNLPKKFLLLKKNERKAHIVHKINYSSETETGTGLCGKETGNPAEWEVPVRHCCSDCLTHMDKYMGDLLYDQENEELYHPHNIKCP